MSTALHWATLAAYVLGTFVYLGFLLHQRRGLYRMGLTILWIGFGLHTIALGAVWYEGGVVPATSFRQSLDVFSWAIMGATLVINLRVEVMILGAFTAPICSLLLLAAGLLPQVEVVKSPVFQNLWVVVHVFTLLSGYGLLALTFVGGLLYLFQDRSLRAKNLGASFQRLPSLTRLDTLNHQTLVAGFLLMTLGLISGAVYAQIALGSYWRWDPKEVWALITWLMYAALLHARLVQGWRGRRGAWLSVLAFAALVFTFIGAGLLLPGYHNFTNLTDLGTVQP